MKRTLLFLTLLILSCLNVAGQNFQFGQFDFSNQRINPALVAADDFSDLTLLYRNQSTNGDFPIASTFFSADLPLNRGRKAPQRGGVGIYFLNDKEGIGNAFKMDQFGLSYAYNLPLSNRQSISFGIQGALVTRQFNYDGLQTESQFVNGSGFDGSLFNGENLGNYAKNSFSLNGGIYWQKTSRKDEIEAYAGISLGDINRPNIAFLEDANKANMTVTLHSGAKVYENKNLSITPELMLYYNGAVWLINAGPSINFPLDAYPIGNNLDDPYMDVGLKYLSGRNVMASVEFGSADWGVGFNYETGNANRLANKGTFEVALKYRKEVLWDKRKKRKKNKTKKKKKKKNKVKKTKRKKRRRKGTYVKRKKSARKKTGSSSFAYRPRPKPTESDPATKPDANTEKNTTGDVVKEADKKPIEVPVEAPSQTIERPEDISRIENNQMNPGNPALNNQIDNELDDKKEWVVRFEFDKQLITSESLVDLDQIIKKLQNDPDTRLLLTGHTDNIGTESYNQALSIRRANSVKAYLVERGANESQLITDGKGESIPAHDNSTEAGRLQNRRVTISVIE